MESSDSSSHIAAKFRLPFVLFTVLSTLAVLVPVVMGYCGFPTPQGDEDAYLPPAVNLVQGKGLVNQVWGQNYVIDPDHRRFIYHGFLEQFLLAKVLPQHRTSAQLPFVLALMLATSLAFTAAAYPRLLRVCGEPNFTWTRCIAGLLGLGATTALSLGLLARPELLVLLFVAVFLFVYSFEPNRRTVTTLGGLIIGASAATSPLSGIHVAMLYCLLLTWRTSYREASIQIFITGLIAAATFFAIFYVVCPYSITEWIAGLRAHSRTAVGGVLLAFHLSTMFFNPQMPGLGLLLAAFFGCSAKLLWNLRKTWGAWYLGLPLAIIFLASVSLNVALHSFKVYNLIPIMPVFVGIVAAVMFRGGRIVRCSLLATLALPTLGIVRQVLLFIVYLQSGMRLSEAQARFEELAIDDSTLTGMSGNMMFLMDDYDQRRVIRTDRPQYPTNDWPVEWIVLGQSGSGHLEPAEYPGFELVADYYRRTPPRLLSIRLGNTTPGYAFAAYRRIRSAALE